MVEKQAKKLYIKICCFTNLAISNDWIATQGRFAKLLPTKNYTPTVSSTRQKKHINNKNMMKNSFEQKLKAI